MAEILLVGAAKEIAAGVRSILRQDGHEVVCPWHSATFDLRDGSVKCPPADDGVTCYRVELDGDDIKIEIP